MLLAEMVWKTADQSQIVFDFSPVRMLTMWLHVLYSYYTVVILYSECDHENNQSTHIYVWTIQKRKNCSHSDFGGRIFTTPEYILLLFRRKKKRKFNAFSWAKTPLVACVFYLVLMCTCFLAQFEQVYLFFGTCPFIFEWGIRFVSVIVCITFCFYLFSSWGNLPL